jgi:WD40 repeat protein
MRTWDVETGAEVAIYDDAGGIVLSLDHYRATSLVVSGTQSGLIQLWNTALAEDALLATIATRADGSWLVMTPDGRVDSSADDGGSMLYWQVGDYRLPGFVGWQRARTDGLLAQACQALCE